VREACGRIRMELGRNKGWNRGIKEKKWGLHGGCFFGESIGYPNLPESGTSLRV